MEVKNYIESGILELYVAGALSETEQNEVEAMIAEHEEVRNEVTAIEMAFENYAMAHAVVPPKEVLDHILSVAKDKTTSENSGKTVQMKPLAASNNWVRYLAYAATILLFVSVAISVYYYNSFKGMKSDLAQLNQEHTTVRENYLALQTELSVINNPAVIAITMKGQPISPASTSVVYWDKSSGDVYVSVNNLPKPQAGMQYQLWALKDGKPIDAGMLDMDGTLHQMKNIDAADAFAVTLEPMGGSINPTMEQLYVVGAV